MSQSQLTIEVKLKDGAKSKGIATGNNAAWICVCGRKVPLLGRTGSLNGVTEGTRVDCPDCQRRYFVIPAGKDQGAVLRVEEV